MIETVENAVQLGVVTVCFLIAVLRFLHGSARIWELLTMFYGVFLLGNLYWLLYLLIYGYTPQLTYISDLSWYTADLFLFILLKHSADPGERRLRSVIPLLFPLFAAGMCLFYAKWSAWLNNIISAAVMSILLYHASRGLLWHRRVKRRSRRCRLYVLTMAYCMTEYCLWTLSCLEWSDRISNPYYWFDALQTVYIGLFLPVTASLAQQTEREETAA